MKHHDDSRRVIVIGSGPAGAMAAYQLVKRNIPVTMLESGVESPTGLLVRAMGRNIYRRTSFKGGYNSDIHTVSGDPLTQWHHTFALGGLSNQWTGAVPRFAPMDFCEGERLDERYRWPISYQQLVLYYELAERLLQVTSEPVEHPMLPANRSSYGHPLPADWRRIGDYARKHGQLLTTLPLADGPPWMIAGQSTAFNSYTRIIRPLLRSPLFQLISAAHALELEWSRSQRRVTAVIYQDRGTGAQHRLAADAAVVAGGPIASTRLLLCSISADFPEGLGNSQGVLGRYLHDHPREWWAFDLDRSVSRLIPAGYLTRRPYESSMPLLATSWTLSIGANSLREKLLSFTPLRTHTVGVQVFGTIVPREQYGVTLHPNRRDEFGYPLVDINLRFDEAEVQCMEEARGQLRAIMEEAGYHCWLRAVAPQLMPGGAVHYGGTARMHGSRRYGVVDGWNRLYDAPNVLVTDASCFTTGPEKNPTLTVMALSARAADQLADDLKFR